MLGKAHRFFPYLKNICSQKQHATYHKEEILTECLAIL